MATNDPTKPLGCEGMDPSQHSLDKTARAAKLGSTTVTSNSDKSRIRQSLLLNSIRDRGEDILLSCNKLIVGEELKNDELKGLKQSMRGLLYEVYKGSDFLVLAEKGGYEKAESFMSEQQAMTAEAQEAMKGIKPEREKPYDRNSNQQGRRPFFQPKNNHYQQGNSRPPFQMAMNNNPYIGGGQYNTVPGMYGMGSMTGQGFQNFHQPTFPQPTFPQPTFPQPAFTRPTFSGFRPRGPPPDKSRSTCKACLQIGHWVGDAACPLNGFQPPHQQAISFQPPPPGC